MSWVSLSPTAFWRSDGLTYARVGYPAHLLVYPPGKSRERIEVTAPFDDERCQALLDVLWPSDTLYQAPISLTATAYMSAALREAGLASNVHPNPAVGAVLVQANTLIAFGHTQPPGGNHAEIEAILSAHSTKIYNATLYTTLEPCCHHGRTPPCTDAILAHPGIRRVVIGCLDPNPFVCGGGVAALRDAGVEVVVGVQAKQCRAQIQDWATNLKHEAAEGKPLPLWWCPSDALWEPVVTNLRNDQKQSRFKKVLSFALEQQGQTYIASTFGRAKGNVPVWKITYMRSLDSGNRLQRVEFPEGTEPYADATAMAVAQALNKTTEKRP